MAVSTGSHSLSPIALVFPPRLAPKTGDSLATLTGQRRTWDGALSAGGPSNVPLTLARTPESDDRLRTHFDHLFLRVISAFPRLVLSP